MPTQNETTMIELFASFMVVNHGQTDLPGMRDSNREMFSSIPENQCIVSHNGSLTKPQLFSWGRDAYKTAGHLKSEKLPKPANFLPCLAFAYEIASKSDIPLEALTLGHQHHANGRVAVPRAIEAIVDWIHDTEDVSKPWLFDMWSSLRTVDQDQFCDEAYCSEKVKPWLVEWHVYKGFKLVASPELEAERDSTGDWGAW